MDYIDIIELYNVSKKFRIIIDENLSNINYSLCQKKDNNINFRDFSYVYFENVRSKKQSLIVLKYIYQWIERELLDGPTDRSILPDSMKKATTIYLNNIFPEKKNEIFDTMLNCFNGWHRGLKKVISKYISSELFEHVNINRTVVDGFGLFELFDYENSRIMKYNENFTLKEKIIIKVNKNDTKIFPNL